MGEPLLSLGIIAALLSALCGVAADLIEKKVAPGLGNRLSGTLTLCAATAAIILAIVIFGAGTLPMQDIVASGIAGVLTGSAFIFYYKSIQTEQITNTISVLQIQRAIVVLFGVFIFNETLSAAQASLMLMVFIGVLLVATKERLKLNRMLVPAFLASALWGFYWVFITYSVNGSGNFLLSLFIAWIVGSSMLVLYMFAHDGKKLAVRAVKGRNAIILLVALGVGAGLINGVQDILFGLVAYYRMVAVGSTINTLIPVLVAIAAYFIYRERLNRVQTLGFAMMMLGVIALSVI